MKSKTKNILFYSIIAAVIISLGYLRDFIFTHLNDQVSVAYYKEFHNTSYPYPLPASLSFLDSMSYSSLNMLKWVFSGVFALLYFVVTATAIKRMYPQAGHTFMITAGTFALLILLAGIFYLYGMISGNWKSAYPLSLTFSHLAQSPVVLMVLIPAFRLAQAAAKKS